MWLEYKQNSKDNRTRKISIDTPLPNSLINYKNKTHLSEYKGRRRTDSTTKTPQKINATLDQIIVCL